MVNAGKNVQNGLSDHAGLRQRHGQTYYNGWTMSRGPRLVNGQTMSCGRKARHGRTYHNGWKTFRIPNGVSSLYG